MDVTTTKHVGWTLGGAILGSLALGVAAPVVLPLMGLGAVASVVAAPIIGTIAGGAIGYSAGAPTEAEKHQLRKMLAAGH